MARRRCRQRHSARMPPAIAAATPSASQKGRDEADDALARDAERDTGGERRHGDGDMQAEARLVVMGDVEDVGDADEAKLDADDKR